MSKTVLGLAGLAGAVALAGAAASAPPSPADQALYDARLASFQFRQGQYDLGAASVAALEAAVQAAPDDPRLWNALGTAYFQKLTASLRTGSVAEVPANLKAAQAAHARALELAPDDPVALSGHGTALAIAARFAGPEVGRQGIAEMNRAVALAPTTTVVRLQRGFTNLGVGAELRDSAAAEADLAYLIAMAEGSKPGDVLHVLAGDLQAELGRTEAARAQYRAAARPGSTTEAVAAERLAALETGGPDPKAVAQLRRRLATDCAMCHGS